MRYDSLRVLLAIAAQNDLELTQFDVQTAFLYGELEERIFMEVPEGVKVEEEESSESARKCHVSVKKIIVWTETGSKMLKQKVL